MASKSGLPFPIPSLTAVLIVGWMLMLPAGWATAEDSGAPIRKQPKAELTPNYELLEGKTFDDFVLDLGHPEVKYRLKALDGLALLKSKETVEIIGEVILKDVNPEVRLKACKIAAEFKDYRVCPSLAHVVMNDKDFRVRTEAINAIGEIGDPSYESVLEDVISANMDPANLTAAIKGIDKYKMDPFVRIKRALLTNDEFLRNKAISILNKIDDPRALEILLMAFKDPDAKIRRQVVFGIAFKSQVNIMPLLRQALNDVDKVVRLYALDGIGRLNTAEGNDELIKVIKDPEKDNDMKERSITYLGDHKYRPSLPTLVSILNHKDPVLRHRSIASLGKIGDSKAIPHLKRIAEKGKMEERVYAISALAEIGGRESASLAEAGLKDPNPAVREISAYVLGKLRYQHSVPGLIRALDDQVDRVRVSAARSLGEIGDKSAIGPLTAKLEGEISEDFRIALSTSIKSLTGIK